MCYLSSEEDVAVRNVAWMQLVGDLKETHPTQESKSSVACLVCKLPQAWMIASDIKSNNIKKENYFGSI